MTTALHDLPWLPRDTTLAALRFQFQVWRRLTSERRAQLGAELSENVRTIMRAGIRDRHPEFTEEQIQAAFARVLLGEPLFAELRHWQQGRS